MTFITFCIFQFVGGDPALHFAGKNADAATVASLRQEMGLNETFVSQYFNFLKKVMLFDWGRSWATSEPISKIFSESLIPSLLLVVPAFLISILVSLALAIVSAYKRATIDRMIVMSCLILMSISFLVYIILLQKWLAFDLNLFPIYGWDGLQYLALPWLIYVMAGLGPKVLLFRAALIEESRKDYVRTARAKGLPEHIVFLRHILKNALIPICTVTLSQMPALITGSLLLEAYFGIPGLGSQLATAIQGNDFPVIQAMTVVGSLACILFNFINDVICAWLDPRLELQ